MINQKKSNTEYNQFLSNLVLWNVLHNRYKKDEGQGHNQNNNYEKMIDYEASVKDFLPEIEKLDRDNIKSYFPLVDDIALIKIFKEVVRL